jgi:hypothetical protein
MWRGEESCFYRNSKSDPSAVQPVACRYTDCAIPRLPKIIFILKYIRIYTDNSETYVHLCVPPCSSERRVVENVIKSVAKENGMLKWQEEWTNTIKRTVTQFFLSSVLQRLRLAIMVTGHGKTRSYMYRFRITEGETCTCKKGPQTVGHLLLECDIPTTARSRLKKHITTKGDNWPVSNDKLTTKTKLNSVSLVRERTIPTERRPLVGEVSANFCG